MRRLQNYIPLTLLMVAALLMGTGQTFAQQSDYQLKVNFENQYAELKASVDEAMTVKEIDSIFVEIDSLEAKYAEHEQLLDNALYPDTYEGQVADLKQRANNAEHKLTIISDKEEKVAALAKELSSYKTEIANLRSQTDSLRDAIAASENSEAELSQLVASYRESLEKQDEMVLAMIDSLFATYKGLQSQQIAELSEKVKSRSLEGEKQNPAYFIQSVITENMQILENDSASLHTEDYLRMYVVQERFEEVWNQIGGQIATLYGSNQPQQWRARINSELEEWDHKVSNRMWASMDAYLEEHQIDLGDFESNEGFYTALEDFVKGATDASREKVMTSGEYQDFEAFYDFWNNKIKSEWGTYVQEGEVLTMSQISSIDQEVMNWQDEAKPRSFIIPILFGASLLTIIGLVIVLARSRHKNGSSTTN
ncbi:hypothetical protein [Gracilimonas mengyeensis]|uniref:Uncharacterized protein n=1 Tax=Gracilimonas mengyeensis TaxID=1302730 RepID=A0A521AK64_9BACT|nr:hypothetical protein [Gracilimonas mengyeensis]SMO35040.1 hypothetical protein SAMN06265219_101195 [Gracilimonas mengyeensis]